VAEQHVIFRKGSQIGQQSREVSQAAIHRLHVGHRDEEHSLRSEELSVTRQDLGGIVDVLQYETHHDDVEPLLSLEALEVRLDDPCAAVGMIFPKVGDNCGRAFEHDVVSEGAREERRRVPVTEPKLEERGRVARQLDNPPRVPVEQDRIIEVVDVVAFVCPDVHVQRIAHESLPQVEFPERALQRERSRIVIRARRRDRCTAEALRRFVPLKFCGMKGIRSALAHTVDFELAAGTNT
jgi:hypothetical protein